MKRPNDMKRGNELLYAQRGNADEFDYYEGPMGGDVRMSIRSGGQTNHDEIEGFQVQKVKAGHHGPRRPKSSRGDVQDLD